MRKLFDKLPISLLIVLCMTLGLAPFQPQPHIWEKIVMLASGELSRAIDWLDLLLHGAPWILLAIKLSLGSPVPEKE